MLTGAGFAEPISVPEQQKPDPDFPTVAFPNPEEPGALDLAFALAAEHDADLIIANDPDADRMALAVPDKAAPGGWRRLSGDDVGLMLGHYLATSGRRGTFATSIVSSEGLAAIATDAKVGYARTLTGFKWLSKVPDLAFGYEEAIGYCVDPSHVKDKDGITAALTAAEFAAALKAEGRTLLDALADVDRVTGNLVTTQLSIRSDDPEQIQTMMRTLRRTPPATLGGVAVTEVGDLSANGTTLPPEQGLRLALDGGWIAVRPSGTEPKLKCYIELGDRSSWRPVRRWWSGSLRCGARWMSGSGGSVRGWAGGLVGLVAVGLAWSGRLGWAGLVGSAWWVGLVGPACVGAGLVGPAWLGRLGWAGLVGRLGWAGWWAGLVGPAGWAGWLGRLGWAGGS